MKNNIWIPTLIIVLALLNIENISSERRLPVSGKGEIVTTTRSISEFSQLKIEGVYNIFLTQGNDEELKVETYENLQDLISGEIKENVLIIKMKDGISIENPDKVNIHITVKNLDKIESNIVGNIRCTNFLNTDVLTIILNGIGKDLIKVNCDQFNAEIASVGEFTIEGSCKSANIKHSGVGSYKGFNFKTDYLSATHAGVGSVEVHADKELDVSCSGIGSVTYTGNATQKNINVTGLGSIKRK